MSDFENPYNENVKSSHRDGDEEQSLFPSKEKLERQRQKRVQRYKSLKKGD